MTEEYCVKLLSKMNKKLESIYLIIVDDIVDMALIPKFEFNNYCINSEVPNEYEKVFLLKSDDLYVGCFFANKDINDNQTDFQFFIKESYRKKINYIKSFEDFIFPSFFIDFDKIKISFISKKVKDKFAEINILEKLKNTKGLTITVKKKDIKNILNNDFNYVENYFNSWSLRYKELELELNSLLKKSLLDKIIEDERFSYINQCFIRSYYGVDVQNVENIINMHIEAVELYFLLKSIK